MISCMAVIDPFYMVPNLDSVQIIGVAAVSACVCRNKWDSAACLRCPSWSTEGFSRSAWSSAPLPPLQWRRQGEGGRTPPRSRIGTHRSAEQRLTVSAPRPDHPRLQLGEARTSELWVGTCSYGPPEGSVDTLPHPRQMATARRKTGSVSSLMSPSERHSALLPKTRRERAWRRTPAVAALVLPLALPWLAVESTM